MDQHKKDTLRRFVYEFVVIVVGVLTAFGLQTISESFADSAKKKRYLSALKQELATNIVQMDNLIHRRENQADSTQLLIRILSSKQEDEKMIAEYLANFYALNEMTCKLGSYEALKTSSVFDKVESIDLITKLNNLDAQIELSLDWQSRVQNISFDLFVQGNDDAINLASYKPEFGKVFSKSYIRKIEHLESFRYELTEQIIHLRNEMNEIQKLIDLEMK